MTNIDKKLRTLAKSSYWQNLYHSSQNNSGINLFENINDFSSLQIRFIYWLSIYAKLYEDLDTFADNLLTTNVINDFERTDAYLIYKHHHLQHQWKEYRRQEKDLKNKTKKQSSGNFIPIEVDLRSE